MTRIRLILCSVLLLYIANICCGTASAASALPSGYDPDRQCSLSVTLAVSGTPSIPVSGVEITIYRIADFAVFDNEIRYTYVEEFADCETKLAYNNIYDEETADEIYRYVQDNKLTGISAVTDYDGKLRFDDLGTGVYLCTETKSPVNLSGFLPFLIVIPEIYGNAWNYDVEVSPKIEAKRLMNISVEKEWNDDGKRRPKDITVQLVKGTTVCDTIVLSESNKWSYKWYDFPYGEDYSVKEEKVPDGYTVTYSNEGSHFIITNTENLIQTGQLKWPIPILACGGLMLIICGFAVRGSGRETENEK